MWRVSVVVRGSGGAAVVWGSTEGSEKQCRIWNTEFQVDVRGEDGVSLSREWGERRHERGFCQNPTDNLRT